MKNLSSDPARAYDRLLYFLGMRDHSQSELETKLGRSFTPEIVASTLQRAHEDSLILPSEELAEKFTEQLNRKNKSHNYIRQKLASKGLPSTPKDDEIEKLKAHKILAQKFAKTAELSYDDKQKAFRYLAYRGFDSSTIKKVIYESE